MNKEEREFKKKYGYVDNDWNKYNNVEKDTISLDVFRKSGKKGGTKTAKRGKGFYRDIGLKGSNIRWNKNEEIAGLNSMDDSAHNPKNR